MSKRSSSGPRKSAARQVGAYLLLILSLGVGLGLALLTHHPESPWLERAQEWPVAGPAATWFREAYLGPKAEEEGTPEPRETVPEIPPRAPVRRPPPSSTAPTPSTKAPEPARRRPAPGPPPPPLVPPIPPPEPARRPPVRADTGRIALPPVALGWAWLLPGTPLRERPEALGTDGAVVARLPSLAYVPVLRRQDRWARVLYREQRVWVDTAWEPSFKRRGMGVHRRLREPIQGSDPQRLKRARKIMGIDKPKSKLGAYRLFTDVEDAELLAFLDGAATVAEKAYFARYARLASGGPERSIVLFAREEDYRTYSQSADLPSWHGGHAGGGILAFYAEGRSRQNLARVLVHEITHLLNDRAIAQRLPPWMEEGLASDLGYLWIEDPRPVSSLPRILRRWEFMTRGMDRSLSRLKEIKDAGNLPSVSVLVNLDRDTFYRDPVHRFAYAHSVAFVRYLLDGEDGRLAPRFRDFLKEVSSGRGPSPQLLFLSLNVSPSQLDTGFRDWINAQLAREDTPGKALNLDN